MKTKTSELKGTALDWAVAKCEGLDVYIPAFANKPWLQVRHPEGGVVNCPKYSTSWSDGGPIIEHENITTIRCDDDYGTDSKGFCNNMRIPVWAAEHGGGHSTQTCYEGEHYEPQYEISRSSCSYGTTPLIAAMRCYCRSKLGDEVEVPEELI